MNVILDSAGIPECLIAMKKSMYSKKQRKEIKTPWDHPAKQQN
jgi:hypothetical protein